MAYIYNTIYTHTPPQYVDSLMPQLNKLKIRFVL